MLKTQKKSLNSKKNLLTVFLGIFLHAVKKPLLPCFSAFPARQINSREYGTLIVFSWLFSVCKQIREITVFLQKTYFRMEQIAKKLFEFVVAGVLDVLGVLAVYNDPRHLL